MCHQGHRCARDTVSGVGVAQNRSLVLGELLQGRDVTDEATLGNVWRDQHGDGVALHPGLPGKQLRKDAKWEKSMSGRSNVQKKSKSTALKVCPDIYPQGQYGSTTLPQR